MDKYEQQQWLEERSFAAAVEEHQSIPSFYWLGFVDRLPLDIKQISQAPNDIVRDWHVKLVTLIQLEFDNVAKDDPNADPESHELLPFFKLLSPEQLSRITIAEFLKFPLMSSRV